MKSYRISVEINSGNPFQLLSVLKKYGFRIYKVSKIVDDYLVITDNDELLTLSEKLEAHQDEYLLKAIYNSGTEFPSRFAFAMIHLHKGPKKINISYEEE